MTINKYINTTNLCIIPARGGSKRIPRKNIKDFLGKPIIAYSIEAALKSELFDEVMVSTDDEEIAEIAIKYGAKVPFMRSKENADDFVFPVEVIDEVKLCYEKNKIKFDYICCVFPTSPLITIENLKKGFSLLIEKNYDSVRPLVRFSYPIQRALKLNNEKMEFFNPEYQYTRSQDLEPSFHDAGQFYWMKYKETLRGLLKAGFEISEIESQDIDNEVDWAIAELKYKKLYSY